MDFKLPEVYLIYIFDHDVYGEGEPFYEGGLMSRGCGHKPIELDWGLHFLVLNAAYAGDDDKLRLLRELNEGTLEAIGSEDQ